MDMVVNGHVNGVRQRLVVILLSGLLCACGRSGLDDFGVAAADDAATGNDAGLVDHGVGDDATTDGTTDSGKDAAREAGPKCGPTTCAKGCCDSSGVCQVGSADTACGQGGIRCDVCAADFTCNSSLVCESTKTLADCTPSNCTSGCCAHYAGLSDNVYCFQGTGDNYCGIGGQACSDCTQASDPALKVCRNHVCGNQFCNSGNCSNGCCVGNECVPGTDDVACGTNGALCQNCSLSGDTCQRGPSPGGQCKPPVCTPSTCSGCCANDICAQGTQDSACGAGGDSCVNCLVAGQTCSTGRCR